jgi:hypothetical protein
MCEIADQGLLIFRKGQFLRKNAVAATATATNTIASLPLLSAQEHCSSIGSSNISPHIHTSPHTVHQQIIII